MMNTGSLLAHIPATLPAEISERLVDAANIRIERIVSKGHHSPPGFWYDQGENEWVLLVKGEARLQFEAGNETVDLTAGMYIDIPAGVRHRVESTGADTETVWLAIFY